VSVAFPVRRNYFSFFFPLPSVICCTSAGGQRPESGAPVSGPLGAEALELNPAPGGLTALLFTLDTCHAAAGPLLGMFLTCSLALCFTLPLIQIFVPGAGFIWVTCAFVPSLL